MTTHNNHLPQATGEDSNRAEIVPVHERLLVIKHVLKIDTVIFGGIMVMALVGAGITDYNAQEAHLFWRYLMIGMALGTTIWGLWRSKRLGLFEAEHLLVRQVVLWGAALVAVGVVYLLLSIGRLNFETTGLMILLILAYATFVDGMLVSWKLYIVGLVLLLTLLLDAYLENYLLIVVLVSAGVLALVLVALVWQIRHHSMSSPSKDKPKGK